ncbi:MAG: nuclear transport factor 2 family protein [Actinobacteria bacterium]|nr:nuclear transport factor 2 family protein [Actinomycetota bacterium]
MKRAEVLDAWRAAWNARDADALVRLADEQIELMTPRGVRQGVTALRDLVAKQTYGVRLYVGPQDYTFRGSTAVSVGPIEWRSVEEGDAVVERQDDGGAAFTFRGDLIARFVPYPDAASALRAEGLGEPGQD